mgnify:CR=1 FL=1
MKQNGYVQKQFGIKTKRFCQTLDLKNEPELIAAYKKLHEEGHVWREILSGIKEVGILEMEIYNTKKEAHSPVNVSTSYVLGVYFVGSRHPF